MARRLVNGDEKRYSQMPDITRIEGGKSVATKLEPVLKTADKYDLAGLKVAFDKILTDPDTHISKMKAEQYKADAKRMFTVERMRAYLTNIYMRGAKLGMN